MKENPTQRSINMLVYIMVPMAVTVSISNNSLKASIKSNRLFKALLYASAAYKKEIEKRLCDSFRDSFDKGFQ